LSGTLKVFGRDSGDFSSDKLLWNVLNALRPAKSSPLREVDLSEVEYLHPYSTATIAMLGLLSGRSAVLRLPKTHGPRDYVLRSGLVQFFLVEDSVELAPSPRAIGIRHLDVPDSRFADDLTTAWESEFGGMPPGLRPRLADHLDEMIRNALAHSKSPAGCVVAAQLYPIKHEVEVVVLDCGQTIRTHLTGNPIHAGITTDLDAILLATKEGVTGTPRGSLNLLGEPNSGIGLYEVRRYCESGNGTLVIASGDTIVKFSERADPEYRRFVGGFPGCLVNRNI
jgi:hypothetical protein